MNFKETFPLSHEADGLLMELMDGAGGPQGPTNTLITLSLIPAQSNISDRTSQDNNTHKKPK